MTDNMRLRHVASQQGRRFLRRYAFLRRISIATTVLTLLWFYLITWGERSVYEDHVTDCNWSEWENWPEGAQPHHLVLIADPQLVDPHTYPGRPWPLSTLTEQYTDLYMARNFRLINSKIDPDTIVFLGDLFDGGREWAPEKPKKLKYSQRKRLEDLGIRLPEDPFNPPQPLQKRSWSSYRAALARPHTHEPTPEEHNIGKDGRDLREFVPGEEGRWSKWDNRQWLKDFRRFSRIFFATEQLYPHPPDRELFAMYNVDPDPISVQNGASDAGWQEYATTGRRLRRVISSLPGNHDLGFGPGVQLPIRDRFQSHFGESNRLDVIGNHTFISLDVLSLAAHSYFADSGFETDTEQEEYRHIWLPGMQFLEQLRAPSRKVVGEALRQYYPEYEPIPLWQHEVTDTDTELVRQPSQEEIEAEQHGAKPNLPVVLLSHVPLFRPHGTECGPLREGNSPIQIRKGYQYQNVLTQGLSKDIVTKVAEAAGNLVQVFSGDDHDYCDVLHRYNIAPDVENVIKTHLTHVREITVKSFSWAMGVRWPGFLLVSLWNPVDDEGNSLDETEPSTIQTYLCLLPNQLAIFMDYVILFVLTFLVLTVDTVYWDSRLNPSLGTEDNPLSPVTRTRMSLPRFSLATNGAITSYNATATSKGRPRGTSTSSSSHSRNNSQYLGVQRSFNARTRSISPPGGPLINQAGYYPPSQLTDTTEDSDEEAQMSLQQPSKADDGQDKWKWRRRSPARLPEKWRKGLEDLGMKMLLVGLPSGLYYLYLVRNG